MDIDKIMSAIAEYANAIQKAGEEEDTEAEMGSLFGKSTIQKGRDKSPINPYSADAIDDHQKRDNSSRRKGSRTII